MLRAGAEIHALIVIVALHQSSFVSGQYSREVLYLEMLLQRENELYDQFHLGATVEHGARMQAVVAHSTVIH